MHSLVNKDLEKSSEAGLVYPEKGWVGRATT